jgi:AraC-like DNA-binding protein
MDALTEMLNALDLKGWIAARRTLAAPWRYDFAASPDMVLHLLNFDGGYLTLEGDPSPLRIEDGGVLLFPFGHAHSIRDTPGAPLRRTLQVTYNAQAAYRGFPSPDDASQKAVLCGAFQLEHPGAFPLLHSLPNVIYIPAEQGRAAPGFTEIVQLIAHEAVTPRLGGDVMLRRLTELLFIHIIRVWAETQAQTANGWLAALQDQAVSEALGLIHQAPERAWKVEELAAEVGLSRAVFSARFTRLVGEPPMKYLVHWRMRRAARMLKNHVEVSKIATLLGYGSEVAFRKAFAREMGMPPARFRKHGASREAGSTKQAVAS